MHVERYSSIGPIAEEWAELVDATGASPFVHPGYVEAFCDSFSGGALEVTVVRSEGRLTAAVPMRRVRGGLHSPTNWHTPEFDLVAEDEESAAALSRSLYSGNRIVRLAFLPSEGGWTAVLRRTAEAGGYLVLERPLGRGPYVQLGVGRTAYEASRDSKSMRDLRRRSRRAEEEAPLTLSVEDGRERLDSLLDEGFAVEASGWKGERGTAVDVDREARTFYRRLARWAAPRGSLRLAFLRLGGRAIAFDFAIEERGIHYLLKTGYDPEFSRFAPGRLLRLKMIDRAFGENLRLYEFLGDFEPWKMEWAETAHVRLLLHAFRRSPAGVVEWAAWRFGRPLAKRALAAAR